MFFLLPPRERERVAEGRAGGGEREGRRDLWGEERERGREGGTAGERQRHREREVRRGRDRDTE